MLCILDGFGESDAGEANAARMARTPALDQLRRRFPSTILAASGLQVGLADGAAGDGLAGHRTLGCGRAIASTRSRIDAAIADKAFGRTAAIDQTVRVCLYDGCPVHVIGVVSPASDQACLDHLFALVDLFDFQEIPTVIHAILDGRDASRRSCLPSLERLQLHLEGKRAAIGTLCGRSFAMDTDGRWDRVDRAFHAVVRDKVLGPTAERATTVFDAVSASYRRGTSDALIEPVRIGDYAGLRGDFLCDFAADRPVWEWTGDDAGIAFNHRGDGLQQLIQMLTREHLPDFVANDLLMDRDHPVRAFREHYLAALARPPDGPAVPIGFADEPVAGTLGEALAAAGKSQLRCAESIRRLHVTTYFNGGKTRPFDGEQRIMVPSPRLVESHEQQPAMNAALVAEAVSAAIAEAKHDFILANLANADVVAQTGDLDATVAAVEAMDAALGRIAGAVETAGGALIVTADHGNCETMRDALGQPSGARTANPVPFVYACRSDAGTSLRHGGSLADVAPTILDILGIEAPAEMTGRTLRAR